MEGQAKEPEGVRDPRALGDTRRQQHERATVVHGVAIHARRGQRLTDGRFVAPRGSNDDAPDLI